MAEVVGVVASGISIVTLAVQIADSVAKLKSYWDQLTEAPEDIRLLMEDIEVLNLLLFDIEDDQRKNPISSKILDSTTVSRCLEHCKRGANHLKELTDDLDADFNDPSKLKSKWASFKVVSKKDKIEKYKSRLERAIRLLSLSHECYTRTLIRLQPDMIASRLSIMFSTMQTNNGALTSASVSAAVASSVTICQPVNQQQEQKSNYLAAKAASARRKNHRRRRDDLIVYYRTQVWLVNWAWDVEVLKSRTGWSFNLLTRNVIPNNSRTVQLIKNGDVQGIQELFGTGQASIYDVTESGLSLLQEAIYKGKPTVCRLLLEQGAAANSFISPRPYGFFFGIDFEAHFLRNFNGPEEAFLELQHYVEGNYYGTPMETRVWIAGGIATWSPPNTPALFRIALCNGPIPSDAAKHKHETGLTLLHDVAVAIHQAISGEQHDTHDELKNSDNLQGWRALVQELVTKGADLCAVFIPRDDCHPYAVTPFLYLLNIDGCDKDIDPHVINRLLAIWLEDLHACGVDLLEYGRKEKAVQNHPLITPEEIVSCNGVSHRTPPPRGYKHHWWRLTNFTYGPSPSDWRIWMSEPTDDFAGDFWSMMESPKGMIEASEGLMPGTWVE